MWFLVIAVILSNPHHQKRTIEYSLFYPTQYTCDTAELRVDSKAIKTAFAAKYKKQKVVSVSSECTEFKAADPDNRCEWRLACSTRINQI